MKRNQLHKVHKLIPFTYMIVKLLTNNVFKEFSETISICLHD